MRYTKMHGAGNSFVLTESLHGKLKGEDLSVLARRLCDPRTGPGADGLIVIVPAEDADLGMLFYNDDGSVGEMCGNGARCLARYGVERGLARDPEQIRIRAAAGLVTARRIDGTRYEVRLNDPSVVDLHREAEGEDCAYIELGRPGLPHAVAEVPASAFDDLDALRERGRALRRSAAFPRGANVSFVCPAGLAACARSPSSAAWRTSRSPAARAAAQSRSRCCCAGSSRAAPSRSTCPADGSR